MMMYVPQSYVGCSFHISLSSHGPSLYLVLPAPIDCCLNLTRRVPCDFYKYQWHLWASNLQSYTRRCALQAPRQPCLFGVWLPSQHFCNSTLLCIFAGCRPRARPYWRETWGEILHLPALGYCIWIAFLRCRFLHQILIIFQSSKFLPLLNVSLKGKVLKILNPFCVPAAKQPWS